MRFSFPVAFLSLLLPAVVHAEDISEADLRGHIEILASDDFTGRKPGTLGENKTIEYIATEWQNAGLQPATGTNSWYAPVRLVDRVPLKQSLSFQYFSGQKKKSVRIDEDQIVLRGIRESVDFVNIPVVHAGYGNLPKAQLEDALFGNVAIIYRSSPLGMKDFPDYRQRKANVVAAGAAVVITVVRSQSRFRRAARRFRGSSTSLDRNGQHASIEGLISGEAANKLLRKLGVNDQELREDAKAENFSPRPLDLLGDLAVETQVREYQSHNVIGKIAGREPRSGAVLFMGHWDHLGECRKAPAEDRICNGAVDNASGIALLIETAKRLTKTRQDRDIYFLATTAEESGLLGARAFVSAPSFMLDDLVAVFNADTVALAPDGKLIAVVGRGETDLDNDLEKVAAAEDREIDKTDKANAFLKRQDGYVFLEKGIPTFMITSAFSDQERLDRYLGDRYHDVGDEVDAELLLGGAVDDANFHVALGRYFGSTITYPAKDVRNDATNSSGE